MTQPITGARKPNASNTGPKDLGALTASGSVNSTSDGQTISELDIDGTLYIEHDNVTVEDCRITAHHTTTQRAVGFQAGVTGTKIINCEITGRTTANGGPGTVEVASYCFDVEWDYCNIHHFVSDGIKAADDVGIKRCFFHHLGMQETSSDPTHHSDGVQNQSGDNMQLKWNFFDMPVPGSTYPKYHSNACVFVQPDSDIDDVELASNWFNGGQYSTWFAESNANPSGDITNINVTNNRYDDDFSSGTFASDFAYDADCNVDEDSGVLFDSGDGWSTNDAC